MWGFEYALLFGLPANKLELLDGEVPCSFPFTDRPTADAHFASWVETLQRWKGSEAVPVKPRGGEHAVMAAGFRLEQYRKPISLRVPITGEYLFALEDAFWNPELWPGQPPVLVSRHQGPMVQSDLRMNLYRFLHWGEQRSKGIFGFRSEIVLSDRDVLGPDCYFFRAGRELARINGDFFAATPDLVIEIVAPASRAVDRGPRKDIYQRLGVPCLWLLDPGTQTVDVFRLQSGRYVQIAAYGRGVSFQADPIPDLTLAVDDLFKYQWPDDPSESEDGSEPEPAPEWLVPQEVRLGLEYLLTVGHPDRRYEIWNNRSPCALAFGSEAEARKRLQDFIYDACRWEAMELLRFEQGPASKSVQVGRFEFVRDQNRIYLNVAVDGLAYRKLLEVHTQDGGWDWGNRD